MPKKVLPPHVLNELPQRLLNNADAYLYASLLCKAPFNACYKSLHTHRSLETAYLAIMSEDIKDCNVMGPIIANLAFSIELYLKLLLYLESECTHEGHSLMMLFGKLSLIAPDKAQLIIDNYPYSNGIESDFTNTLQSISDCFEKWRYSHEEEFLIASEDTLFSIAITLQNVVQNIYSIPTSVFS